MGIVNESGAVSKVHSMQTASHASHKKKSSLPIVCYRCGLSSHKAPQCRFKEAVCHNCGKKGHIKKVCKGRKVKAEGEKTVHLRHMGEAADVTSATQTPSPVWAHGQS